jgi:hypothetical protein
MCQNTITTDQGVIYFKYNIILLDFNSILQKAIKKYTFNLYELALIDCKSDATSIFLNYLIQELFETIKSVENQYKIILYVNNKCSSFIEFNKVIHLLFKNLCTTMIINDLTFNSFLKDKKQSNITVENAIFRDNVCNFQKFVRFLKKYKLQYLYKSYFTQPCNKILFAR